MKIYVPHDFGAQSVGADEIAAILEKRGAQVVRNGSRGLYWLEPMIEVESDQGRFAFGPLNAALAEGMDLDAAAKGEGEKALGAVDEIEWLKKQNRQTFKRCGTIEALNIEDYKAHGGLKGLERALKMTPQEVVDEVKTSGLRGRGGAGFPTGIKWQTVLDTEAAQKYIVCNADEGDSATFADRMLMEGDPFTLIEGMVIAGIATGATMGYVYIRSEYPQSFHVMNEAIKAAHEAGLLGDVLGSGHMFEMEARLGAGAYVCGEETALLESLEGKRGLVRAKPPLPAIEGLFGQPTVINNVLSLASVPVIMENGGATYAELGFERSRGTIPVQIGGKAMRGGMFEVEFGMTLGEIVNDLAGGTWGGDVKAVQVGGPLGAYFGPEDFDLKFDYEAFAGAGGLIGHAGITIFGQDANMAQMARFAMEFCAIESCGKCTPCRLGSTRGIEVIDNIVGDVEREKNVEILYDLCDLMESGSLCALGGFAPYPVRSALKIAPEDFGLTAQQIAAE